MQSRVSLNRAFVSIFFQISFPQGLGVLQNVAHFDAADTVKEATANANLDLPRLRSMHTDNRELADNTARLEQDLKLVKAA